MAGILVEYSRFLEVQQRRAGTVMELVAPPEPPAAQSERPSVDDRATGVGPSRAPDASTTGGVVDVR